MLVLSNEVRGAAAVAAGVTPRNAAMAMSEGVIAEEERFSMHGFKHRGITDTEGNRGDKQDAAGHKSPTTTGRYDHDLPVVKPPRKR